ncbi:MAG: hypothetical protein IKH84_05700 [Ottowia sp.]|nr:hypothetical protein [Ottowia sp.]
MLDTTDFPVKWMHSHMPRAPMLNGTPGALISLLDAFLVTGWGAMTPQRVNVVDGIATVTCSAGDTFEQHMVIDVAGADDAALCGQARVLTSTSTSFTFATAATNGLKTGAITIKAAPAGWQKNFSGAEKAVYKSTDPQAHGFMLRIDDSGAQKALVRGYAAMDDVDTGGGAFPAEGKDFYWHKSNTVGAAPVRYDLAADSRFVMYADQPESTSFNTPLNAMINGFGDPIAVHPAGDVWCTCLCASGTNRDNSGGMACNRGISNLDSKICAGGIDGNGVETMCGFYSFCGDSSVSGSNNQYLARPDTNGRIMLSGKYVVDSQQFLRGVAPGVYSVPQKNILSVAAPRDTLRVDIQGHQHIMLALPVSNAYLHTVPQGLVFIDITGPWR